MKRINIIIINLIILLLSFNLFANEINNEKELELLFLEGQKDSTVKARKSLVELTSFMKENEQFQQMRKLNRISPLSNDQRELLRSFWVQLSSLHLNLDSVIEAINNSEDKIDELKSEEYFLISYAAFLSEYRSAIEFIRLTREVPGIDLVLNESVDELGLQKNTFKKFKSEYLNLEKYLSYSSYRLNSLNYELKNFQLYEEMKEDINVIQEFNRYKGIFYTVKNASKVITSILFKLYFPLQKNISEWMGDERIARGNHFLISDEQISDVQNKIKAGDIMIERRNWYLSNIGLPGFWPHAALYIGTPNERDYLEKDEDVIGWVKSRGVDSGSFEELLRITHGTIYEESLGEDINHHQYRVLEAMSEGVVYTSLEHSADADSLAVLRPRLKNLDIAKGLLTAFYYKGRPYDFNFDFRTDSSVVCSELVFYTYQETRDKIGLNFPITNTLGRPVVTPNNIIKDFSEKDGTDAQQFDFVLFLDGNDKKREAVFSNVEALKKSWNRPKWFIFTQKR